MSIPSHELLHATGNKFAFKIKPTTTKKLAYAVCIYLNKSLQAESPH